MVYQYLIFRSLMATEAPLLLTMMKCGLIAGSPGEVGSAHLYCTFNPLEAGIGVGVGVAAGVGVGVAGAGVGVGVGVGVAAGVGVGVAAGVGVGVGAGVGVGVALPPPGSTPQINAPFLYKVKRVHCVKAVFVASKE